MIINKIKNKKENLVYFEHVTLLFYPVLFYYLYLRKYKIFCFDFTFGLKKYKWIRKLIEENKINTIYVNPINGAHGCAIEETEIIFNKFKSRILYFVKRLYNSNEVASIFKKTIVNDLFQTIYIDSYLSEQKSKIGVDKVKIRLIPYRYKIYMNLIKNLGSYDFTFFEIDRTFSFLSYLLYIFEKIKFIIFSLGFLTVNFLGIVPGIFIGKEPKQKKYQNIIAIDSIFQIKFPNRRSFDFLIDQQYVKREDSLFLFRIPKAVLKAGTRNFSWNRDVVRNGYNYFLHDNVSKIREFRYWKYNSRHLFSSTSVVLKSIFQLLTEPRAYFEALLISIIVFTRWKILSQHVTFKNFIYTNAESSRQVALNILMRESGCITWSYAAFLGGGYIISKNKNFYNQRHVLWAFLNSDVYLGVSSDAVQYNKLHRQNTKRYYAIGSIYSEMVLKEWETLDRKNFLSNYFPTYSNNTTKIISFFDTSFVDNPEAPTTYEDCKNFYLDIAKLLNEKEDLLIIIKPSKNEEYYLASSQPWSSSEKGEKIIGLWKKLKSDKRVFWADDDGDNPLIMAASDLVVTHCISSTTAEALGAGKKAIWYETRKNDLHIDTIFDKIPGLMVHGYDELLQSISYWLESVTDEEYRMYLKRYINGTVLATIDGTALTRMRKLIAGVEKIE